MAARTIYRNNANLPATTPEPTEEGVKLEIIDLGGIHDTADRL